MIKSFTQHIIWISCTLMFLFGSEANGQIIASETEGCAPLIQVEFSHTFGTVSNILWDFDDGATSILQSPSHTFQNPGTYTVTLTGDGVSESIIITVIDSPDALFEINGVNSGCLPLEVNFTDLSTSAPGATIVEWSWDFGDGGVSVGSTANPTHIYSLIGIFDVSLVVEDNNGCTGSFVIPEAVTTSIEPDIILSSDPADLTACDPPLNVNFNISATSNSPQSSALIYDWDFGNGNTSATASPPLQIYDMDGSYPVSITVTDDIGCSSTEYTNVFIGSPEADWSIIGGPTFCDTVYFVNNSDPAQTNIDWGNGLSTNFGSLSDTIFYVYSDPGDYTAILTTTAPGCEDMSEVMFSIDEAEAFFTSSPNYGCNPELTVSYVGESPDAVEYQWIFGTDTLYGQNVDYTHFSPASDDPYYVDEISIFGAILNITTSAGCIATYENYEDTIQIPYSAFAVDLTEGCQPLTVMFSDSSISTPEIANWQWHTGDGNIIDSATGDPLEYIYTTDGDFESFLVITTVEGCVDTSYTIPINVGTTFAPDFEFNLTQVCPYEEIDFSAIIPAGIDVDFWSFQSDMGQLSGCFDSPILGSGFSSYAGMHDVTLMANYNGCISEFTVTDAIEVLGPIGHFTVENECETPMSISCSGNITGADNWIYDFGDGNSFSSSSIQDANHTYLSSGDYTITLTSFASTGCDPFVETFEVHIRNIEASFSISNDVLCEDGSVELSGIESTDVHEYCNEGYLWLFDPDLNIYPYRTENSEIGIEVNSSGTFEIQLVVQDINGCVDTASVELSSFGISADIDYTIIDPCEPFEVDFTGIVDADLLIDNWSWSFDDGNFSSDQNPLHVFDSSVPPSYQIVLTVTDTLGCSDQVSVDLSPSIPNPQFSVMNDEICAGDSSTFVPTFTSYVNYEWDYGDGSAGTEVSPTHTYIEGGSYNVQLVVTNDLGCTDTLVINNAVSVQDYPEVGFFTSVDDLENLCYPILIEFTDTSIASVFAYREWDLGTGFPVIDAQTVGTIYDQPGNYLVTLEVGTTFGCIGNFEQEFEIEGPVADFTISDPEICWYDEFVLNIVDSSEVAYFTWDFGDGIDSANVSPVTYSYPQIPSDGNTFIQLITWSSDSVCSATTQHEIIVNQTIADFDRNFEVSMEDTIHCFGITDVFTNFSTDANSFQWDFGNGIGSTSESPNYYYPEGGDYMVTLIAENTSTGCLDTLSKPLTVYPEMNVGADDNVACLGDTIFLNAYGGADFYWTPEEIVSDPFIADPYIFDDQNNSLEVLITDTNDCSMLLPVNADYIFQPPPPLWIDTVIELGDILSFQYIEENYHYYDWTSGSDIPCDDCSTFLFPGESNLYQLIVTDLLGCYVDTFHFEVDVLSDLIFYMPNSFTPNQDGFNDFFFPVVDRALELDYNLTIWNRYGQEIWTTSDLYGQWEGNSDPQSTNYFAQSEVYVWRAKVRDLRGELQVFQGTVTVVR